MSLAELKKANKNRDPSQFQLGKLVSANLQLTPNQMDEVVFLFPFNSDSIYRKLEVTGNARQFEYKVMKCQKASSDATYQVVYSDIGGSLFEDCNLGQKWEDVKVSLQEWLHGIESKRSQRTNSTNSGDDEGPPQFPPPPFGAMQRPPTATMVNPGLGGHDPTNMGMSAADVIARQQQILQSIQIQQRNASAPILGATSSGSSRFVSERCEGALCCACTYGR